MIGSSAAVVWFANLHSVVREVEYEDHEKDFVRHTHESKLGGRHLVGVVYLDVFEGEEISED